MLRVSTPLLLLAFIAPLFLVGCDSGPFGSSDDSSDDAEGEFTLENCTIPTNRLVDGGVPKDGIPALTNPPVVDASADQASYLADDDRVIGLLFGDEALAVPHNILWHHEIVNLDDWAGRTFAVTYCPLTGSSLAFDRSAVDGAEFGVSGLLFDNNLVMYNREDDESLWPQMNREANCGAATGTDLEMLPVVEMTWGQWKELHPDTEVISQETGYSRTYTASGYPYGDYEEIDNDRLLVDIPIDKRRPPKERLLGIPNGNGGLALPFGELDDGSDAQVVEVSVEGREAVVLWSKAAQGAMAFNTSLSFSVQDGRIVDDDTGSVWSVEGRAVNGPREGDQLEPVNTAYVAFWFAWAAFQPDTQIWERSS